jgi:tetratricopeptide (TPR) repeat protein
MELLAYAFSDDVIGVKRAMERCEVVAKLYPRWGVDFHLARFHYRRLQGDHAGALEMLGPALEGVAPGRHIDWALVAGAHVMALNALGRPEEAANLGLEYLAICEREDLTGTTRHLMRQVAEALSKAGRFDEAVCYANECVREAEQLGITGLILGACYETRARIALATGDRATFHRFSELSATEYRRGQNPALIAKCERLVREAELAETSASGPRSSADPADTLLGHDDIDVATRIA